MAAIACTTSMCADGRTSVQQMRSTFDSLTSNPSFDRSHYEPTVIALEKSFQDNYSVFSEWIPFNPTCCAIKDIGAQADQLTSEMLASVGAQSTLPGPASTKPPVDIDQLITLGMVAVGIILITNVMQATRR